MLNETKFIYWCIGKAYDAVLLVELSWLVKTIRNSFSENSSVIKHLLNLKLISAYMMFLASFITL